MSCGVGHTHGSDLALLWLWRRPAAIPLIRPLAWEPPYATGAALKRQKNIKKSQEKLENLLAELPEELKALKSRMNNAKERISDLENKIMEITQSGQQTENEMKKHGSNIRDLWDNIKQAKLCIMGIPEGEEKKRGLKIYVKTLCLKTF